MMRKFNWKRGLIGGGIVFGVMAFSFYPIISKHNPEPEVSYEEIHNCLPIPDDVPPTFKGGTPIDWDCEMAAYYYNGDLVFHKDTLGNLIAIEKIE